MPYAAVTEPGILVRTPTFVRRLHPVTLDTLPGRDFSKSFIQVCPSLKYKFLWVHADNANYRQDYVSFLRTFHKVAGELPGEFHADHLYNRDRAILLRAPFIRMVLAPGPVNSSHGAGYEKSRSTNGLGSAGRDHKMDEITLMKLCGIPSPRKGQPLTAEMLAHVHRIAEIYGMNVKDIEKIIKNLMDVAAFETGTV
jgi:hypothetical protein